VLLSVKGLGKQIARKKNAGDEDGKKPGHGILGSIKVYPYINLGTARYKGNGLLSKHLLASKTNLNQALKFMIEKIS
jgi:hypothetical protein